MNSIKTENIKNLHLLNKIFIKKKNDNSSNNDSQLSKDLKEKQIFLKNPKILKHEKQDYKYLSQCQNHPNKKAKFYQISNIHKNFCSICAQGHDSQLQGNAQQPNKISVKLIYQQYKIKNLKSKISFKIATPFYNKLILKFKIQNFKIQAQKQILINKDSLFKKLDYRFNNFLTQIQNIKIQIQFQIEETINEWENNKKSQIQILQDYNYKIQQCNNDFTDNYDGIINNVKQQEFENIIQNYQQQMQTIVQEINKFKNQENKIINLTQDREALYKNFNNFIETFEQTEQNINKKLQSHVKNKQTNEIIQLDQTSKNRSRIDLKNNSFNQELYLIKNQSQASTQPAQDNPKQSQENKIIINDNENLQNKSFNKIKKYPKQVFKSPQTVIQKQPTSQVNTKLNQYINILSKGYKSPSQRPSEQSFDKNLLHRILSAKKVI